MYRICCYCVGRGGGGGVMGERQRQSPRSIFDDEEERRGAPMLRLVERSLVKNYVTKKAKTG